MTTHGPWGTIASLPYKLSKCVAHDATLGITLMDRMSDVRGDLGRGYQPL